MKIDAKTGQVTLSSGFTFDANLTQSAFVNEGLHDPAHISNPGTPWFYYPLRDGEVEENPLNVNFCFYREILVTFYFGVNLYPTDTQNGDNFSYEIEENMQKLHARMLASWFGPPHKTKLVNIGTEDYPTLATEITYGFKWGTVWCAHDVRSGITNAGLHYSKSEKWARKDYQRRNRSEHLGVPNTVKELAKVFGIKQESER